MSYLLASSNLSQKCKCNQTNFCNLWWLDKVELIGPSCPVLLSEQEHCGADKLQLFILRIWSICSFLAAAGSLLPSSGTAERTISPTVCCGAYANLLAKPPLWGDLKAVLFQIFQSTLFSIVPTAHLRNVVTLLQKKPKTVDCWKLEMNSGLQC